MAEELVEKVARLWVANGGDVEGLDWAHQALKRRVAELIESEKEEDDEQ